MTLSDYERRRLGELEKDLAADDPVLARELATGKPSRLWFRRYAGIVLDFVGFGLLILGVAANLPGLGVLGFLLMLCGACGFLGRGCQGQWLPGSISGRFSLKLYRSGRGSGR